MKSNSFVLRGDLCDSRSPQKLRTLEKGYLVCIDGLCAGRFPVLPEAYADLPLIDCAGKLVIPGLTDLHVHAPQYPFRGLGMDLELLDWLQARTFPEEAKYADLTYAQAAYGKFVHDLRRSPNTRACVFATVHRAATAALMDLLEDSGLVCAVGKVNMDRDCPDALREETSASLEETRQWLEETAGRFERVTPILTPRFVPSCSDTLMKGLGALAAERGLPVQSHLSENRGEVELVSRLRPDARFYGEAYDRDDLFGAHGKAIMAHCVLSGEEETALMGVRGVFVAHCPQSNANLASGVAPVRRYLERGLRVGLGSDVAGGVHMSILRAMADAIQCSKLRWAIQDKSLKPLTVAEAFWLGTAGGGEFFGRVGRFEPGYELDAVVIDDAPGLPPSPLSVAERLERAIYLAEDRDTLHKFVRGRQLF